MDIPYRTKIHVSKFQLGVENLSNEKFCPSKILSNVSIQKSGKNRTKVSKFWLGVENFVRRKILSVENFVRRKILSIENFVQYFNAKVGQKSDKSVEILAWCRNFCPTKYFVRRNFCPTKFCPIRCLHVFRLFTLR